MDGFFVKYLASVVALLAYAAPLYLRDPKLRGSQADTTQVRPMLSPKNWLEEKDN